MGDWTGTVPTFTAGAKLRGVDMGTVADILTALTTGWTTWSPTLTNLTLGNGTVTAKYRRVGKAVDYRWKFKLGSTSAVGSNPTFTLPVAPHSEYVADEDGLGLVWILDPGVAITNGVVRFKGGSIVEPSVLLASSTYAGAVAITATVPHTWGTSDSMAAYGTYETA